VLSETWRFNRAREVQHDRIAAVDDEHKLEVDLVDLSAQLRSIAPSGFEQSENLIEQVERPALAETIQSYLEQNRRVNASD